MLTYQAIGPSTAIPAIPTSPAVFNFRGAQPKLGSSFLHVAAIILDVVLNITAASTCSAIATPWDYPLYITSITFGRDPSHPIMSALTGWDALTYGAMTAAGLVRGIFPTATVVNTAATPTKAFRFIIPFEKPVGSSLRYEHCWPVAAFRDLGQMSVQLAAAPLGSTGLTLTDGLGTIDCSLACVPLDEINIPPDVRWSVVTNSGTGSVSGINFPDGVYRAATYNPRKLGGQTLTGTTIDGSKYGQKNLFPSLRAIGSGQTTAGQSWQELWAGINVMDTIDTSGSNMVIQKKAVPLFQPGIFSDATKELFIASGDFRLDVTTSDTVTNGHNFLVGNLFEPDYHEAAKYAAVCGINDPVFQPRTTRGRAPSGVRRWAVSTRMKSRKAA